MIAVGIAVLLLILLLALFSRWPGASAEVDRGIRRAGGEATLRVQAVWQSPLVSAGAVGAAPGGVLLAVEQLRVRSDLMPGRQPSEIPCDSAALTGSGGSGLC